MNQNNYRKHLLGHVHKCLVSTNYDIPKHCPAFLLTEDIYVIGYEVKTVCGLQYLPVFDNRRCKQVKKVHQEMYFKLVKKTLLDCDFPHLVVDCIIKNLILL
jgi:hypothetical protein